MAVRPSRAPRNVKLPKCAECGKPARLETPCGNAICSEDCEYSFIRRYSRLEGDEGSDVETLLEYLA